MTAPAFTPPSPATPAPASPARARRRRRWLRVLFVVFVTLCLLYAGLTRGFLGRWIVEAALSSSLGARAKADAVSIGFNGAIEVRGLRLRVPAGEGAQSDAVKIDSLRAELGYTAGSVDLRSLSLDGVTIRVSQSIDDGSVNLAGWNLPKSSGPPKALGPPRVIVRSGRIEMGEHSRANGYTTLKAIEIAGTISPREDGSFAIRFDEVRPKDAANITGGAQRGVSVEGSIREGGLELVLTRVNLADWPASVVPTPIRPFYTDLNLDGSVIRTRMAYVPKPTTAGGAAPLDVSIDVADVALSLPGVPERATVGTPDGRLPETVGPQRLMRMTGVRGTLQFLSAGGGPQGTAPRFLAQLSGELEDLPYRVQGVYEGVSTDAPFEVRFNTDAFNLGKDPRVIRFAPPIVIRRLANFGFPTMTVDAEFTVRRGAAVANAQSGRAEPAPLELFGKLDLRDGSAAFHRFPYEFTNLRGSVRFSDREIAFDEITGTSPSGATIRARGIIAPPDENPKVEVYVEARNVPLDDSLRQAMGPERGEFLDAIMNRPAYEALLAAKLIAPTPNALSGPADNSAPIFEMGGRADIDVRVFRELGDADIWDDVVDVRIPKAGVLPARFHYPLLASDVHVRIRDGRANILAGDFTGLLGGDATIKGTIDVRKLAPGESRQAPELDITATDFPIDARLIHAIPRGKRELAQELAAAQNPGVSTRSRGVREVLRDLNLEGRIDCRTLIGAASAPDATLAPSSRKADANAEIDGDPDVAVDVDIAFKGVTASPALAGAEQSELRLTDIEGGVKVGDALISVNLTGQVLDGGEPLQPLAPGEERSPFAVQLDVHTIDQRDQIDALLSVQNLRLDLPVGELAGVFAPAAGESIIELWNTYRPRGRLDADVRLAGLADEPGSTVTITGVRGLRLGDPRHAVNPQPHSPAGERTPIAVGSIEGVLRVMTLPGEPTLLQFEGFRAHVPPTDHHGGELPPMLRAGAIDPCVPPAPAPGLPAPGVLSIEGRYRFDRGERAEVLPLHATWYNGSFESPLAHWMLAAALGPDSAATALDLEPRGVFDLSLATCETEQGSQLAGTFSPRSLELFLDSGPARFDMVSGTLGVDRSGATLNQLRFEAADWSLDVSGWFMKFSPTSTTGVLDLTIDSRGISDGLKAALPGGLGDVLTDLSATATGPVRARDVRVELALSSPEDGQPFQITFKTRGEIRLSGAAVQTGVEISEANGTLKFQAERPDPAVPVAYTLVGEFDSMRAAGLRLTNTRTRINGGGASNGPGGAAGGVGTASAPASAILVPLFAGDCHSGRLSATATLRESPKGGGKPARVFDAEFSLSGVALDALLDDLAPNAARSSERRGKPGATLDAGFSISGEVGKPLTRRGRGMATAGGGEVIDLPVLLPLMSVSNLQLPSGEPLDLARVSFFLQGPTLGFEEVSVYSSSMAVLGFGTMQWPETTLNMVFNSTSLNGVPILSSLIEGLRNELITTSVKGTLAKPDVKLEQFRATRQLLSEIFGDRTDQQERLLRELEQNSPRGTVRVEPR